MSKRYNRAFLLSIFCVLALVALAFFLTPIQPQDADVDRIEPVSIIQTGEYEREFIFDLSNADINKKDIAFFTKHQFIKVYGEDHLIYEYTQDGGIWGHTTGAFWTFINVPYDVSELKLIFTSAYGEVKGDVPTFYIGDKLTIYQGVLRHSLPPFLISLLIMVFGIVLIIYWIFVSHRFDIGKSLLYLGIFATLIGLYLINESDVCIALIQHRTASVFMTYLLLMCLCSTSIFFIKEFLGTIENIIWKILCGLSLAEFIICLTLQFLDIIDLRQTLFLSHILIGVTAIYLLVTLAVKFYRREFTPMLQASLVSIAVLSVSVFFNLAVYYSNTAISDTSMIGRLGFLIFIFILSREAAKNSFELMEKGRHAKIYEELAITDMLTGLHNRNAYIGDIEALTNYQDIMLITFDLNNLKKCNDTLGHAEGDRYILSAANMINNVFQPYGSCYRIGGDEFCALIKNAQLCPIGELTSALEEKESEYNSNESAFPMHISYGYAIFDSRIDLNLEQTRDRADALMYEHKRKSKGC